MIVEARGRARISISTAWQEFCCIPEQQASLWTQTIDEVTNTGILAANSTDSTEQELSLDLVVPEYINVEVYGGWISLNMVNKLQGDLIVHCQSGSIQLHKVKGEQIELLCGDADIQVEKALEGNVHLQAKGFKAKMLNVSDIKITSSKSVHINALYCRYAQIQAKEDVLIDLLKGTAVVVSSSGDIRMNNVDGAIRVLAESGGVEVQANNLLPFTFDSKSEEVRIDAPEGSTQIYLSPQVRMGVDKLFLI